jgi:Icc-related predicted phosphoesterase
LTTLYFATDVHGSNICWNKFINAGKFYKADVIILGGDMTGKAIVPIVHQGNNTYRVVLLEHESILHGEDEVNEMARRIKSRGYYPYRTTPEEMAELQAAPDQVNQLFKRETIRIMQQWLAYADEKLDNTGIRCYVAPGNDDIFELDDLIHDSKHVKLAEGRVIPLDDYHEMISSGWTNPTPWHTYREESEEKLAARLEAMISKLSDPHNSVFNLHVPPYGSNLDAAPEMTTDLRPRFAGNSMIPVGSKAVRQVIEKYQPLLGLFGHIHESKGTARLGRTLCVNPGSVYEQGYLNGAIINLGRDKIKSHILTNG